MWWAPGFVPHCKSTEDVFVKPKMELLETGSSNSLSSDSIDITHYKDIFCEKDDYFSNIYILGKPGVGKSFLSKHLVYQWSKGINKMQDANEPFSDLKWFLNFDFVFFLELREMSGIECVIENMIMQNIIAELSRENEYDETFIKKLLQEKRCLIILDGLDEWKHPSIQVKACIRDNKAFPHRKDWEYTTVLTTARPGTLALCVWELLM